MEYIIKGMESWKWNRKYHDTSSTPYWFWKKCYDIFSLCNVGVICLWPKKHGSVHDPSCDFTLDSSLDTLKWIFHAGKESSFEGKHIVFLHDNGIPIHLNFCNFHHQIYHLTNAKNLISTDQHMVLKVNTWEYQRWRDWNSHSINESSGSDSDSLSPDVTLPTCLLILTATVLGGVVNCREASLINIINELRTKLISFYSLIVLCEIGFSSKYIKSSSPSQSSSYSLFQRNSIAVSLYKFSDPLKYKAARWPQVQGHNI